jgi:dephospho-CoA kinase
MTRVLLTGMSAVGKSTVVHSLVARGYTAVDADDPDLSELVDVAETELTGVGAGQDWVWREDRIAEVLAWDVDLLFLSGCAANQGRFYPQFDHIILLSAPAPVIVERLATRTTNQFGKQPDEVARVLALLETIEPLLRASSDLEIDTSAPLDDVVDAILRHVRSEG